MGATNTSRELGHLVYQWERKIMRVLERSLSCWSDGSHTFGVGGTYHLLYQLGRRKVMRVLEFAREVCDAS